MPTPEFVLTLREKIGHDPLPLVGAIAVVFDARDRVLMVRRADDQQWTLVTGIIEPGEEPAVGALREIEEETGVTAEVERLLGVTARDLATLPNGDQVWWTSILFRCRHVSGEARVNDDESIDAGWFEIADIPKLPPHQARALALARADEPAWFAI
ncbi:NUDIX domain-containing protein [Actinoplanes sp. NPDC051411]|uniref:NUDIX hydrolase n=1 Tax=Actinoplanes sp. NPDC051411 TaxID=3155522 RepID=UPI003417769B